MDVQPAIGYTQRVFDTDELDFGFAYDSRINSGSNVSQVMAHVAYRFDL